MIDKQVTITYTIKMNQKRIEPYQVYTTPEAAEMLGVSEMLIINSCKKGDLKAVAVGRGWKILGENLLVFLGSPSAISASEYDPARLVPSKKL